MIPNDKQLKSLMKKIKTSVEKKHEVKKIAQPSMVDDAVEISESTDLFREMKKLPFSE
jgi:hypothetical protein